jgi:hypothetical protein
MLYYELTKRLPKLSISLTNSIKADGGVQYNGVSQALIKVLRVWTKCKVQPWTSKGQRFMT